MTTLVGNYLDPDGVPVIATQVPPLAGNYIGGRSLALAWTGRWIRAASESEPFHANNGGLKWDHGRERHKAGPGDWVVWTGTAYRVVSESDFAATYSPVPFEISPRDTPTDDAQGGRADG